jgi:hypothetical protein
MQTSGKQRIQDGTQHHDSDARARVTVGIEEAQAATVVDSEVAGPRLLEDLQIAGNTRD